MHLTLGRQTFWSFHSSYLPVDTETKRQQLRALLTCDRRRT